MKLSQNVCIGRTYVFVLQALFTINMKVKSVEYQKPPSAKRGQSKYPFDKMKVGDSFAIEEGKRYSVATLVKRYGDAQEPKQEFSVKLFEMSGEAKLRCIRTK